MNKTYKVTYSPQAADDLRNIFGYIAFELLVPDIAEKQVNRIREKVRSLDFMPEKYAVLDREPWKSRNTHKFPVDNYVVYYAINNENMSVMIVRILYSGQNADKIFNNDHY